MLCVHSKIVSSTRENIWFVVESVLSPIPKMGKYTITSETRKEKDLSSMCAANSLCMAEWLSVHHSLDPRGKTQN